jgi:hypothetical protein
MQLSSQALKLQAKIAPRQQLQITATATAAVPLQVLARRGIQRHCCWHRVFHLRLMCNRSAWLLRWLLSGILWCSSCSRLSLHSIAQMITR